MAVVLRYIIIFICIYGLFFGGSLKIIGLLSLRLLLSVFSLFYVILNKKQIKKNSIFSLYLVYLLVYIFANVINGELLSYEFWQSIIAFHLPCVFLFLFLTVFLKTEENLTKICTVLSVIYLFNCILTIGQFFNDARAWELGQLLGMGSTDIKDSYLLSENNFGRSICNGLFYSAVDNGYFIASFLPIVTKGVWSDNKVFKFSAFLFLCLAFTTSYMIQQRMCFLLILAYLCFIFIFKFSKAYKILFVFLSIILISFMYELLFNIDMGRLSVETENTDRYELFDKFATYLTTPESLFGGRLYYFQNYGLIQHNSLLASWIFSGLLGFLVFVKLYFKCMYNNINSLIVSLKLKKYLPVAFLLSCIFFNIYSLTHSSGIHQGDITYWFSYSLFLVSFKNAKFNRKKN